MPEGLRAEEALGREHFDPDEPALLVDVEDDLARRIAERGTKPASSGIRLM